jgi:hypothetical protein
VCLLQNSHMVKVACSAIADMAYIIPDVVLPLVYQRFQVAILTPSLFPCLCN